MKDYQKHLNEFDAHLTLKNFSKATRTAYGGAACSSALLSSSTSHRLARRSYLQKDKRPNPG